MVTVTSCAASAAPAPTGAPTVWTADSLSRIGERDAPRTGTAAAVLAARGETESFQVVASGGASGLSGVDLDVGPLTGPGKLPASAVTRYREHYVDVKTGSPDGKGPNRPLGPGRYADALVPFVNPDTGAPLSGEIRAAGADVEPGRNQPYWIDVTVPPDAAPGVYRGTYTVRAAGGFTATGEIRLTVSDVRLPARPALRSAFLNWSNRPAVSRELLRNRLTPTSSLPPATDPLSSAITVTDTGFFSGADQYQCRLGPPPDVEKVKAAAARARPGTLVLNYTADEIDRCPELAEDVKAWGRALHAGGVANLITAAPDPATFDDGTGRPAVDIWALLPIGYDEDPALVADAIRRGMQVWSYNALVQDDYSPKWMIDFSPVDHRIQPGFLNQAMGLSGLLYWRVDNWIGDAWKTVETYDGGYPGEGLLVYPGEKVGMPGGAVPSIRLKWLRDGVDDYDYIALARARGDGDAVTAVVRTVGTDWSQWTRDPRRIQDARRELTDLITNAG